MLCDIISSCIHNDYHTQVLSVGTRVYVKVKKQCKDQSASLSKAEQLQKKLHEAAYGRYTTTFSFYTTMDQHGRGAM